MKNFYAHNLFPFALALAVPATIAQQQAPQPQQPAHHGITGTFEILGKSLVNAQQMFLGSFDKVYITDRAENNPGQINGHPAWAQEWDLRNNDQRAMEIVTNSFCAGGGVMGDGTWSIVGGNQAVTYGGVTADRQDGGGPYNDLDGRNSVRLLSKGPDGNMQWSISPTAIDQRWYPTVETLEDGSMIIIGGCRTGGFVNDPGQNNPTYEFYPSRGQPVHSPVLENTLPTNLFPLTWLLPSGKLLIQSNWQTILMDYKTQNEQPLDDMPAAVRTYPASAGTIMMALTPNNNYTATIMFCGGSNVPTDQWRAPGFNAMETPTSASCVQITPDVSGKYRDVEPLPEPRVLTSLIYLPDQTILALNGARKGTAGYGNDTWAVGQSYSDDPILTPLIYDPKAAAGKQWSSDGFSPSTVPRMYHSSATLLPDGSVFISGSNPNSDWSDLPELKYPSEHRTERFFPKYYNMRRPQPKGLISQFSYGGPSFDVSLDAADLFGDVANVVGATVVLIKTGFSTHAINMGQRLLQLQSTYTGFSNNTAVLHVAQLPPNPAIITPGPAWLFVVVNGVPSVGVEVMLGSGKIETQPILAATTLRDPSMVKAVDDDVTTSGNNGNKSSAGVRMRVGDDGFGGWLCLLPAWLAVGSALLLGW